MQVLSYYSRISTTQEPKLFTCDTELCAITFALSQYEFLIFGSRLPIIVFTDHNTILFLLTRKRNLFPRQYKTQKLLTKFTNLQIVHTTETNLSVADMLSRDFSQITNKICQLQHQKLPPHNNFIQLKPNILFKHIQCLVLHEDILSFQKETIPIQS